MKILHYAEYISIDGDKAFSRNITGYGYMVVDIANSIAKEGIDVDLLTFSGITDAKKHKNINILKKKWKDIILNINYRDLFMGIVNTIKTIPKSDQKRMIISYIILGLFQKVVKQNGYDIIHFHGISPANNILMQYCLKNDIKFIVTLHGLNAFSKSIKISTYQANVEKNFLKKAYLKKIPVSVISQGIKKEIMRYLQVEKVDNFQVISNGCVIEEKFTPKVNIYKKYNIKHNKKIALCVGNLSKNKNQLQVVRAYAKLSKEERSRFVILFVGNPEGDSRVKKLIEEFGLEDELILCGCVLKDEMSSYFAQADFTVLASISEGFGLSIIEGFVYGLPNLTFKDLDAVDDIYDEKVMITLKDREDDTLSHGMIDMLEKRWNADYIKKNHAKRFSLDKMAIKYIEFYKKNVEIKNHL
jgi:glycosyltransferase involved in cell wall biosynthesis